MARMRIVVNVHLGGVCRNVNILIQWSVSNVYFSYLRRTIFI